MRTSRRATAALSAIFALGCHSSETPSTTSSSSDASSSASSGAGGFASTIVFSEPNATIDDVDFAGSLVDIRYQSAQGDRVAEVNLDTLSRRELAPLAHIDGYRMVATPMGAVVVGSTDKNDSGFLFLLGDAPVPLDSDAVNAPPLSLKGTTLYYALYADPISELRTVDLTTRVSTKVGTTPQPYGVTHLGATVLGPTMAGWVLFDPPKDASPVLASFPADESVWGALGADDACFVSVNADNSCNLSCASRAGGPLTTLVSNSQTLCTRYVGVLGGEVFFPAGVEADGTLQITGVDAERTDGSAGARPILTGLNGVDGIFASETDVFVATEGKLIRLHPR